MHMEPSNNKDSQTFNPKTEDSRHVCRFDTIVSAGPGAQPQASGLGSSGPIKPETGMPVDES
ncbi:hypothetical protein N7539_004472 [Penicillium diatomitis]|uniref:Uncharacterized protein n=1 Tax=Penicillium diatomitis TaxID=2819901 RepID=A0A9X0BYT6_9EURO|nr:uncharacterized protein N7539_004472 [Penicillium diatomitis]KAJ5489582.1 hypothetical protein N7539_004472 [Penicillium diatomitis]